MAFRLDRISATNLAGLAADNFCPRCFWLRARLGFKNPFAMFPKIFNELDKYQKGFTESYLKETGKLPPWLADLGDVDGIVSIPEYGRFVAKHECGVDISGVTDHVFRLSRGMQVLIDADQNLTKNLIIDYKTSRPGGDRMFEVYKTQLSIYAWILPRFGLGDVEKMALVYYEPLTGLADWKGMAYPHEYVPGVGPEPAIARPPVEGFLLRFRPYVLKIEPLDINPLVLKAKALAESDIMPAANLHCTECARVISWMSSFSAGQDGEITKRQLIL